MTDTIKRDQDKFKRHQEYNTDTVQEIKYSLQILGADPVWQKNYDTFVEAMVFDKKNSGFEKCYENLQEISNEVFSHMSLKSGLKLTKRHDLSSALTPAVMKQLKLYVEMQLRLTNLCEEKSKFISDPEKYQALLHSAKILDGRIRKLAKGIIEMPEIKSFLPAIKLSEKNKHSRQGDMIHDRFQKNEITIDDVNTVLRHIKHSVHKLSKEICHEIKF